MSDPSVPLHVLIVGDSVDERAALCAALNDASVPVTTEAVATLEEALARIGRTDLPAVNAALLDLDAVRRIAIRQEAREIMAPVKEQVAQTGKIIERLEEKVEALSPGKPETKGGGP